MKKYILSDTVPSIARDSNFVIFLLDNQFDDFIPNPIHDNVIQGIVVESKERSNHDIITYGVIHSDHIVIKAKPLLPPNTFSGYVGLDHIIKVVKTEEELQLAMVEILTKYNKLKYNNITIIQQSPTLLKILN